MGWAVGWEPNTRRWRGYGVPAVCEEPGCDAKIDRGLAYACGGLDGCGRFFCKEHLYSSYEIIEAGLAVAEGEFVCARCLEWAEPYPCKPETVEWLTHVLTDESWEQWLSEEPEAADSYRAQLRALEKEGA